jgi:hypothetical protein
MPTGLASQVAIAPEVTYGTIVAPTIGLEFNQEQITAQVDRVHGKALRNLRMQRADRSRAYVKGAGGTLEMDLLTKGLGKIFKAMFGSVVSTQPNVGTQPLHWKHLFTPDDSGLLSNSLTLQVGRPSVAGSVIPFTYAGVKVNDWTLSANTGEEAKLSITVDAKTEDLVTALATPTYPTGAALLTFIDAALTINASAAYVTSVSISGKNALNVDRRGLGNIKKTPVADGMIAITGSFNAEFEDTTHHAAFLAGTTAALVLTFSYGLIDAGQTDPFQVIVTLPAVEYTGDPPTVQGPSIVANNIKFNALYDGTNPIISLEYHTTDTTP